MVYKRVFSIRLNKGSHYFQDLQVDLGVCQVTSQVLLCSHKTEGETISWILVKAVRTSFLPSALRCEYSGTRLFHIDMLKIDGLDKGSDQWLEMLNEDSGNSQDQDFHEY